MVLGRRIEHGIVFEVFHRHLDNAQHENVRHSQSEYPEKKPTANINKNSSQTNSKFSIHIPYKPVHDQPKEVERAGRHLTDTLRQFLQLALGVRPEINVRHQKSAHEEKRIHTVRPICDRLEEEFFFHHLAQLHVIRILENDNARVAQNHPRHRDRAQSVNARNRIAAHASVADRPEIRNHRKRQQQFGAQSETFVGAAHHRHRRIARRRRRRRHGRCGRIQTIAIGRIVAGQVLVRIVVVHAARYHNANGQIGFIRRRCARQIVRGAADDFGGRIAADDQHFAALVASPLLAFKFS